MRLGYENIAFIESHMRHDFENYVYPVHFSIADINPALKDYVFQVSNGAAGEKNELSTNEIIQLSKIRHSRMVLYYQYLIIIDSLRNTIK
jgi:hypothetical protein